MWIITAVATEQANFFEWSIFEEAELLPESGIEIRFPMPVFSCSANRTLALKTLSRMIEEKGVDWLLRYNGDWSINLDKLKIAFKELRGENWLNGNINVEPEFETRTDAYIFGSTIQKAAVVFYAFPDTRIKRKAFRETPVEIYESIAKYREDHPYDTRKCFLIMQFTNTKAHQGIYKAINGIIKERGMECTRADEKEYHDDLLYNVLTYIYGSDFGIAVFERIEKEEFNPNISWEVGYMMAIGKPVCLLKDKNMRTLHSDLIGKLYKEFDPLEPERTIPNSIDKWLNDKAMP